MRGFGGKIKLKAMKNTKVYIEIEKQRAYFKEFHESINIGATDEFIDLEINKSMEIWCEANPEFISHLEIDLSIFSNTEIKEMMWEFARIENYEKAQEIKNFIEK